MKSFFHGTKSSGAWAPNEMDLVSKIMHLTKLKPMENVQIIVTFIVTHHPQTYLDMVSKSLHTACGMYKYRAIRQ
jgi:hypothetical protein